MKLLSIAFIVIALNATASPQPQADEISDGVYRTQGSSHYQNGEIQIKRWAEHYLMTGKFVQGKHLFDVNITLRPVQGNHFRGDGYVTVDYGNGTGCRHRVGAQIWAYADKVYLRENTPRAFPFHPNGPCTAAGPYVWFNHPEPYFLE